jgi:phosphatidate cytidylyltransferase
MAFPDIARRVIVSVVAIPIILFLSYAGSYYFLGLILLIGIVSFIEFGMLASNKKIFANKIIGILSVLFLIINEFFHLIDLFPVLIIISALILLTEIFRKKENAISNVGATLLGIFYIGLFASTLVSIREFYPRIDDLYTRGGLIIISMLASIWICDSAAYFVGTKLGKHKIIPRISPSKSWEGAIAGFVFSVLTMIIAQNILIGFLTIKDVIILGVIIGIIGQLGDFVESMIKRDSGAKDSSGLIPGHGGMFDRFDSLLFSAPVIWLYLRYFQ